MNAILTISNKRMDGENQELITQSPNNDQPINHLNNITNELQKLTETTNEINQKKNLVDLTTYQGNLMLLFNEISMTTIYYDAYWFLQYFVPIVQIFILFLSPFLPSLWDKQNKVGDGIRHLSSALSFSPKSYEDAEYDLPGALVLAILYILIGLWFCIIPFIHMVLKHFSQPILYVSAVLSQIVMPFLLIPFSSHVGLALSVISNDISSGKVFLLIVLIVVYILVLIGHTFLASMNCFLITPNPSPIASYKGHHPAFILTFASVYIVLANLSTIADSWVTIIVLVAHILCNVYFIYDVFQFPFVCFGTHVFAASLYTGNIIGHLLSIVQLAGLDIPEVVRIVIPYVIFIISLIVYYFILRIFRNQALDILSNTETHNDAERREYYGSLNIKSKSQFSRIGRIGMSNLSPLFIDWTFPIYAGEITMDMSELLCYALFVTFFPTEEQAAAYFIEQITKTPMSSFRDRFIIYRVKSTYLKRFLSDSEEASASFEEANEFTEQTLMTMREFWLKLSADPESIQMRDIEAIGNALKKSKKLWKQGMAQFPNDSRFAGGFANFLLECMVDPEAGVFLKLKSAHLQSGLHADIDPLFRAFAIARPFIFREKICDKKGNIKRSAFEITSGTTVTISTTAMERLQEDIDHGAIDDMIGELYLYPNLRKTLKRATSHYKPRLISIGISLTLLAFVIFIVGFIISMLVFIPIFDNAVQYFDRIDSAMHLRTNIFLGKCAIMLQWASQIGKLFTNEEYQTEFQNDESILNEPATLRSYDINQQVAESMDLIVSSYIDFSRSFNEFMASSSNTSLDVLVFNADIVERDVCNSAGKIIKTEKLPLTNSIALLVYLYYGSAYGNRNYTEFVISQEFCQADTLMRSIPLALDQGVQYTRESLITDLDENRSTIRNFTIVFILFTVAIWILLAFPLIIYYLDAKRLFNALKSVEPSAAQQGSEHVLLTSQTNETINIIHASQSLSTYDIVMIILNILFSLVMMVSMIILFVTLQDSNSKSLDLVDWSITGTRRLSVAYGILAQMTEAMIFQESENPPFTTVKDAFAVGLNLAESLKQTETWFFNGDVGIKGNFEDIDNLHLTDQCEAPAITATKHQFYHCLGLDQLISTYILYAEGFNNNSKLNGPDFINFFHLCVSEVSERLTLSSDLLDEKMESTVKNQLVINVFMLILYLISMIVVVICVNENAGKLKTILKASMILFRRIPPPEIANCKVLKNILVGKERNDDDKEEIAQYVIFDSLPTAVLALAKDTTIEAMNENAKKLFGFLTGQIIGQKLDCLIHPVDESEINGNEEMKEEDAGAIHLYQAFEENNKPTEAQKEHQPNNNNNEQQQQQQPLTPTSSPPMIVLCHCSDDSNVRCEANLYHIPDSTGTNKNYILFLSEKKDDMIMDKNLKEAKEEVTKLKNQLVPSDVQGFIRGDRTDFTFLSKTVTVVTLQIYGFFDLLKKEGYEKFFPKLDKLFQHLEVGCVQFPPMMKQRQFTDTFIAIGGLFNVTDDAKLHAQAAMAYATKMIEDTANSEETDSFGDEFRLQVGISTGGPLVCGLVGDQLKVFDCAGPLLTEAITLAENSLPSRILISQSTKDLLSENTFESAMVINHSQTFWVPNFIENRSVTGLAASGSFVSSSRLKLDILPKNMNTVKMNMKNSMAPSILEDDEGFHPNDPNNDSNHQKSPSNDKKGGKK